MYITEQKYKKNWGEMLCNSDNAVSLEHETTVIKTKRNHSDSSDSDSVNV